uniref:Uncharacterized protein n=1 Tax=Setaria italica TaxID=4555 RepID=K3YNP9_SETIT
MALHLHSDDTGFYARAAIAWLLSACLAAAILMGWIRGQGFRARTVHLATLFYTTWLSRDALKLHLAHGILPESRRQCRGPVVPGVLLVP